MNGIVANELRFGETERGGLLEQIPVRVKRNPLARRYRLYVDREGQARATIPRRGTLRETREFVQRHLPWLRAEVARVRSRLALSSMWRLGQEFYFRGERVILERHDDAGVSSLRFGSESIPMSSSRWFDAAGLRAIVEGHLRRLAMEQLPPRTRALAESHGLVVHRVTIRNQRSRWGSCSARGGISLNWRLVQVPPAVCDYIILHELMHRREMNHSPRYWALVERICPDYVRHEAWLKRYGRAILA